MAKSRSTRFATLQRQVSLSPYEGRTRVCLITDLHLATTEAANALLKTLEEPPPRVILVLTATDIGLLLPTVVSRCQVLALRPVATEVIVRCALRPGKVPPRASCHNCALGSRTYWLGFTRCT